MSSIVTCYILRESQRSEFLEAHRNEKTISYERGFLGIKEVVRGERFLWEYLDCAAAARLEFPFSGFALIDYLFSFVLFPGHLQQAFASAEVDESYYAISADLARALADFLESHLPSSAALIAFVPEEGCGSPGEYADILLNTHDILLDWLRRLSRGYFAVLHITF